MGEEVKIDKELFHERLSHFDSSSKADKRAGDTLFGGAGSVVIIMGKAEESNNFLKNSSMHVC